MGVNESNECARDFNNRFCAYTLPNIKFPLKIRKRSVK